jgi:hypothetical protein
VSILYGYSEPLGWRPLAFYLSQGYTKASGANLVRYFNNETTYHFPRISSPPDKLDLLMVAIHYDGCKPMQLFRERRYTHGFEIVQSQQRNPKDRLHINAQKGIGASSIGPSLRVRDSFSVCNMEANFEFECNSFNCIVSPWEVGRLGTLS